MPFKFLLDFLLSQAPNLILDYLLNPIASSIKSIYHPLDADLVDDDQDSKMGEAIWFDGVDKRLIEAHSKKIEIVKGCDESLLTNDSLISYRGIVKRRKQTQERSRISNGDKSSDTESAGASVSKMKSNSTSSKQKSAKTNGPTPILDKYMLQPSSLITEELALDCEMVECYGHKSVLARVSIVNLFGRTILDTFVAPPSQVTDYRTRYSGIRAIDLVKAPSFETVQAQVARIIKDRIVVGHAVHNDFKVLMLHHPSDKIRDTSPYFGKHYGLGKTPSLKRLSGSILGVKIQSGEHDSVQDAQATMKLYVKARERWTESLLKGKQSCKQQKSKKQKTKPQKKKKKAFFVETL